MPSIKITRYALALLLAGTFSHTALADGDPVSGQKLAEEHCARCHDIAPIAPFKLHPPSFASIAVYRSESQILGRILFPSMHASMPQMAYFMTPENIDDMVAYILSLEKK